MTLLLKEIGATGFVDIAFMALLIYSLLVWLKTTRRATSVLAGILIVALFYLLAQQFDLLLMAAVLQGFFAVFLIALVVIFQEELRYLFERVAAWSLRRKRLRRPGSPDTDTQIEILVRTLCDLARERIGALVVLRARDVLPRHLEGGQELQGQVSEAILKSLFDPHSIGHDGAVVIEDDRITSFGVHLPLSKNRQLLSCVGTRHAAALGLSELTDALCLVVSEERGTITAARHGRFLETGDAGALRELLQTFFREIAPRRAGGSWRGFLRSNLREKAVALALAIVLWFVLVHESRIVYRSFRVPVEFARVPTGLRVTEVRPSDIEVTLSAPRKSFYFVKPSSIRLAVRTWELTPGRATVPIATSDLTFPHHLVFEHVEPREVTIEVAQPAAPTL